MHIKNVFASYTYNWYVDFSVIDNTGKRSLLKNEKVKRRNNYVQ